MMFSSVTRPTTRCLAACAVTLPVHVHGHVAIGHHPFTGVVSVATHDPDGGMSIDAVAIVFVEGVLGIDCDRLPGFEFAGEE